MFELRNVMFGDGIPAIAVPIIEEKGEDIRAYAYQAAGSADLIEFRADAYAGIFDTRNLLSLLSEIRDSFSGPILFTLRTKREGGLLNVCAEEYLDILRIAIGSGCIDLIDIELETAETEEALEFGVSTAKLLAEEAHEFGVRVVMSRHDFAATPSRDEIYAYLEKMKEAGCDIAKEAYMPEKPSDVDEVLSAGMRAKKKLGIPTILISMGELGRITRTYGEVFGSAVTFACLDGKASAPGQLEAGPMREILMERHLRIEKADTLFLNGFMGAGKSSVARELGERCGFDIIEMDEEIEAEMGTAISQIFAEHGESYFRDLETEFIASLSEEAGGVVSCGGGAVLRPRNVVYMKSLGKIVLLTARPETVMARLENEVSIRPVLKGKFSIEGIAALQDARRDRYMEAMDIAIETDGRTVAEVAEEILKLL